MLLQIEIKIKFIDENRKGRSYISDGKNILFMSKISCDMLMRWETVCCEYTDKYEYNWKSYYEWRLKKSEENVINNDEILKIIENMSEKIKLLEEQNEYLNNKMNEISKLK